MHFDAGKLNKKVTFYTLAEEKGDLGVSLKRKAIRTCWAKIRTSRSYESTIDQKLKGEFVYTILVRYFKGLALDMLIGYNGEVLKITQINNVDERNYAYEITAKCYKDKKGLNDG